MPTQSNDEGDWIELLRWQRKKGGQFTDHDFPADDASLGEDVLRAGKVSSWRRVSDIFGPTTEYVELAFYDDDERKLCGGDPNLSQRGFEGCKGEPADEADEFKGHVTRIVMQAVTGEATAPSKPERRMSLVSSGQARQLPRPSLPTAELAATEGMGEWLQKWASQTRAKHGGCDIEKIEVRPSWDRRPGYVPRVTCRCAIHFAAYHIALFQRGEDGTFVDPADVEQGELGDCYLLGALSTLGIREERILDVFPDLPQDLILDKDGDHPESEQQYTGEGLYAVRVCRGGEWRTVVIDDFLPCDAKGQPAFARSAVKNGTVEIWVMLAEKAYAKLYGSFSAIIGGSEAEALQDLTGGLPSRIGIGGEQAEPRFKGSGAAEEAWTLLNSLLDEGAVVCCSRQADAIRRGIIPNHAYGILRALEVKLVGGKSAKLVQVRNPWGRGLEWDGAWSDADSSWTRVAPESQRLLGRNVGTGQQVSDGTWWMTVADWQANFHRLECCRHLELLPEWTVHAVAGEWQPESTETGQWHLFPQYHLQVAAGSRMVVCLQTARGTRDHKVSLAIAPMLMEGPPTEAVGTRVLKFGERLQHPVFRLGRFSAVEATTRGSGAVIVPALMGENGAGGSGPSIAEPKTYYMQICTLGPSKLILVPTEPRPNCPQCGKLVKLPWVAFGSGLNAKYVHSECSKAFQQSSAEGCVHCGAPVSKVEGKFSGKFYNVEGGKCHAECYAAFKQASAPKCIHCGAPVCKVEGKFDGRFMEVEGKGKVHGECYAAYQVAAAPRCLHCGEPVTKVQGKFDGRYYEADGGKVHGECWAKYKARPKSKKR